MVEPPSCRACLGLSPLPARLGEGQSPAARRPALVGVSRETLSGAIRLAAAGEDICGGCLELLAPTFGDGPIEIQVIACWVVDDFTMPTS